MEISQSSLRGHNAKQVVLGILGWLGSLFSTAMMFGFFAGAWFLVCNFAGFDDYRGWARWFGIGMALLIWVLGVVRYLSGQGGIDYWDSIDSFLPREGTAGAVVVDHYASQVTAPGVVLSSLFVAAPRWLIEGTRRFGRRVPVRAELASRMESLRARLDETRRWKPLTQYAEVVEELQFLHWMGIAAVGPRGEILCVRITLEAQTLREGAED